MPGDDAARTTRGLRQRTVVIAAIAVTATAGIVVPITVASAATTVLVVNSTAWGGPDAKPGDGVCATSAGVCTLRAAIEESNALKGQAGDIMITVDPSIPLGTKMTGTSNASGNNMLASSVNAQDTAVIFNVTAPVIIDLGHRLRPDASDNDTAENATFYLNAPDIQVLNAEMVMSSGSSFVMGPLANRVTVDGDTTGGGFAPILPASWGPERFVVFREGASNITVRNYQITGYYDSDTQGGIFVFNPQSPFTPMNNIVIDRVQVLYSAASSSTCSSSVGSTCRTRITNWWNGTSTSAARANTVINGLSFTNLLIKNMTSQRAFTFADTSAGNTNSATITNLVMEDNVFLNNQGSGTNTTDAFIVLPYNNNLLGTSSISRNVFSRANPGATSGNQTYAIYYYGGNATAANSVTPSNLTIADNYFNGYAAGSSIRTERTGLVTVARNTFGTGTGSQGAPGTAEEYTDGTSASTNTMYNTFHGSAAANYYASNQSIRTWAPSAPASVLGGPLPASALVMPDPRAGALVTCTATVPVGKITATDNNSKAPGEPVTLQAYWTSARTAELYLGQVTGVTGTSATIAFQLPVGAVALPDGGTATPVNPTSGVASGYVRLQTHVEGLGQVESSQYSRFVALSGTCRPVLTINQAAGMTDPTSGRDLHFTLTSGVPLDLNTVTTDDIALTATAVPQTIDATRLNPRVVSVTPVAGSGGTVFDVVVRVDDSALVSVAVAAGAVATPGGLTNQGPATSADGSITFLNPIQANPPNFTLMTGEPKGKSFTIGLAPGAPLPTADLVFTAAVDQPAGTPLVTLSTSGPILRAGHTSTDPVTVTAAAGNVTANTATTIALTMTTADANYDGLVVPAVTPYLFSTDPTMQIAKTVYVNVTDASTPARIEATGTLAPAGTRLMDGQALCFVYTVANTSADDWATSLTNITVTDSDTRLGSDGVIGTIPVLGIGQTTKLSACTSLLPGDTTVTNAAG